MNKFKGNIKAVDPNAFGFFYCNITAPDNLNQPIIQLHLKPNSGSTRTIAPLVTFSTMVFSEEMDTAIKLGYHLKSYGVILLKELIFSINWLVIFIE